MSARVLYEASLQVLADRGHPLHKRGELTLSDLVDEEWILPPSTSQLYQEVFRAFRAQGLDGPRVRVSSETGRASILQLVQGTRLLCPGHAGIGGALRLLPLAMSARELALRRTIGVHFRKDAYISPLAHRLTELFIAQAKSE